MLVEKFLYRCVCKHTFYMCFMDTWFGFKLKVKCPVCKKRKGKFVKTVKKNKREK